MCTLGSSTIRKCVDGEYSCTEHTATTEVVSKNLNIWCMRELLRGDSRFEYMLDDIRATLT